MPKATESKLQKKKPLSNNEINNLLNAFCQFVYEQNLPRHVNGPLYFVADSIKSYLTGNVASLDRAFGLKSKRATSSAPDPRLEAARKILALRLEGKSWVDIMSMENPPMLADDVSTIQRAFRDHEITVIAEEFCRRLDAVK